MTDPSLFKGSYLVFDENGRPTGQAGGTGAMDALAQIQRELGKETDEIAHTAELPPQDLSDDEINELTARAARKRAERRLDQN